MWHYDRFPFPIRDDHYDHYDPTSGLHWDTFTEYNGQGQLILQAAPSAVTGYNDAYADLLDNQNGGYKLD